MVRSAATIPDDVQLKARALGDPTRFRIFRYILEADRPVDIAELTSYTQLNHNAVRQHLAVLTSSGLVAAASETRTRPGRPRLIYQVVPEVAGTWEVPGPYEYLATMLSEMLRTGDPAEEVGRRAGLRRAGQLPRSPEADPLTVIEGQLAQAGFRPSRRERGRGWELSLGRCPFERAAAANPATICKVHLGLARGLAEGLGGLEVDDLIARNPHRAGCRLLLSPTPAAGEGTADRDGPPRP